MALNTLMTNEEVLLAAGVTQEEINLINSTDAMTKVNTLDGIYLKLISFIYEQRIEWANSRNPLRAFEKGYAAMNGGSLNGFFSETLIPYRDRGDNGLYGGKKYEPKDLPINPYTTFDYGKDPLQFVYGINAKIKRALNYDREDLRMALKDYSLLSFIDGKLTTIDSEEKTTKYEIENAVINCENFQYMPYANAPVWTDPYELNAFIHKVIKSQDYPNANIEYKKLKFNSTRNGDALAFVGDMEFLFDFATRFQLKSFIKPFIFRSEDSDTYGVEEERESIIEVDKLTPTTIPANTLFDPLALSAATLPANTKLVGRIISFNATKFGDGVKTATTMLVDDRKSLYQETSDYCFNMNEAYVNVPILIDTTKFNANRIFYVQNVPNEAPVNRSK